MRSRDARNNTVPWSPTMSPPRTVAKRSSTDRARRSHLHVRRRQLPRDCVRAPRQSPRPCAMPFPTAHRPCDGGAPRRSRCHSPVARKRAASSSCLNVSLTPTPHVRRKHDRQRGGGGIELGLLRLAETCRADDHLHAVASRHGQMRGRAFRTREIDQVVGLRQHRLDVVGDRDTRRRAEKNAPASCPSAGLPGRSSAPESRASGAASTASTSIRPMRPDAPAIAILINYRFRAERQTAVPRTAARRRAPRRWR